MMKVLIWAACIIAASVVQVFMNDAGIMGAIPAMAVFGGMYGAARFFCKKYDERKSKKAASKITGNDTSADAHTCQQGCITENQECRTAFYVRTETATEIKIEWKTLPRYILPVGMLLYGLFVYLTNITPNIDHEMIFAFIGGTCFLLTIGYYVVYFIRTWRVSQEIKAATEESSVAVSGKKGSFVHPMVVTIRKNLVMKNSDDSIKGSTQTGISAEKQLEELPAQADITPPQIRFCRKCGKKLIEGSAFCSYCGTAVLKE